MILWTHTAGTALAAFWASLVEFVEALTIVLAVGVSRGWRIALLGAAGGLVALALLVLLLGPLLTANLFPLAGLQIVVGILLVLFGLRWLKKAVLRAAGIIPLHDEARIYDQQVKQMIQTDKRGDIFDAPGFMVSFKAVLIEGIEVVFIVVAVAVAETSLVPACLGAAAALLLVTLLGIALHRPLTKVPENSLKFGVGVILSAFGVFWIGEGSGRKWPGGDLTIPCIILLILACALIAVRYLKKRVHRIP
jgi:uncharacterized membrane protein